MKGVDKRIRNGMTNRGEENGEENGETESLSYASQRLTEVYYVQTTPGA